MRAFPCLGPNPGASPSSSQPALDDQPVTDRVPSVATASSFGPSLLSTGRLLVDDAALSITTSDSDHDYHHDG